MKTTFTMKRLATSAIAVTAALAVSGCVTPSASSKTGLYAKPIGNAPVTANPTPYSAALVCLGDHARGMNRVAPRIAVGRIIDYTGKVDAQGGRQITQGASLMAISAFSKAGARLVERFDTSVSELELKYANNKLIGADPVAGASAGAGAGADADVRKIFAGQVPGSDFYLVGGITELNYNIRSVGAEAYVGQTGSRDAKGNLGGKLFVMNIGLDLRLVDTKTLEVADVISYQKQIIGREVRAGVFTFWDDTLFDVGAGERALEPIQMAVRSSIERSVVEMMSNLYGVGNKSVCADALRAGGDPLGNGSRSMTGDFRTATGPVAAAAGDRRAEPNAWNAKRDDDAIKAEKAAAKVEKTSSNDRPVSTKPAKSNRPVQTTEATRRPTKVATASVTPASTAAPAPVAVDRSKPVRRTSAPRAIDAPRPPEGLRGASR
jgi:curli production assembly/transport component CsgG/holdfast attachment protein HfaB